MKLRSSLQLALVAGLTSFAALQAQAQGAYVKLGGAYNMGVGGDIQYNITGTRTYDNNGNPGTYKEVYERTDVNLGKGITAGGALGYMFSENVGAEIGVNYLIGSKNEVKSTTTETFAPYTSNITNTGETYSRMLLIQPALVISAGREGLNPYARFGVVAGKGTVYQNQTNSYQTNAPVTPNSGKEMEESEFTGGWAFGLQGGLGLDFGITENIGLFAEVTFSNLRYSPDKGELTAYSVNGKDELSSLDKDEKEFEFVNEHEENSANEPSSDKPSEEPKFNLPFGSAGFGLGLKFKF